MHDGHWVQQIVYIGCSHYIINEQEWSMNYKKSTILLTENYFSENQGTIPALTTNTLILLFPRI